MRAARVLVVDDDPAIREMLNEYLGANGFEVEAVGDGAAARAAVARDVPDVVLLDVGLPGEDGLSLARWLRQHHDVGIVMVTAADDVVDRVVGLEMGADDYLAKPFDPRELRARLKSVLRRLQDRGPSPAAAAAPSGRLPIGRCTLDLPARRLLDADGREIPVTAMEFEHPHRAGAPQGRGGPGQSPGDPHRARRRLHVRAAAARLTPRVTGVYPSVMRG